MSSTTEYIFLYRHSTTHYAYCILSYNSGHKNSQQQWLQDFDYTDGFNSFYSPRCRKKMKVPLPDPPSSVFWPCRLLACLCSEEWLLVLENDLSLTQRSILPVMLK
jgi:hypothetical protein